MNLKLCVVSRVAWPLLFLAVLLGVACSSRRSRRARGPVSPQASLQEVASPPRESGVASPSRQRGGEPTPDETEGSLSRGAASSTASTPADRPAPDRSPSPSGPHQPKVDLRTWQNLPPSPLPRAAVVLEAHHRKDAKALADFASNPDPDPWLVADVLCERGEHAAALAFARAAQGAGLEDLPAYVASRRDAEPDPSLLKRFPAFGRSAAPGRGPPEAPAYEAKTTTLDTVLRIRMAQLYAEHLGLKRTFDEASTILFRAATAAERLGWMDMVSDCQARAARLGGREEGWPWAHEIQAAQFDSVQKSGSKRAAGRAALSLALTEHALGLPEIGSKRVAQAIGLLEEGRPSFASLYTLLLHGQVMPRLGRRDEGLACLDAARRIAGKLGDDHMAGWAHYESGYIHHDHGAFDQAISHWEAARAIFARRGDEYAWSWQEASLGRVYLSIGKLDDALSHTLAAAEVVQRLGATHDIGVGEIQLGQIRAAQGQLEEAREHFEEAMRIFADSNDREVYTCRKFLADLDRREGKLDSALVRYRRVLEDAPRYGNMNDAARMLIGIANVHLAHGKPDQAQDALARAETFLKNSPHRVARATLASSWARLHLQRDEAGEAVTWAKRGVKEVMAMASGLAEGEGGGARDAFQAVFSVGLRAALRAGDAAELFWFLEQGRAGSLREGLGARGQLEGAVLSADTRQAWDKARRREEKAHAAFLRARGSGDLKATREAGQQRDIAQAELARAAARIERESKQAAAIMVSEPDDLETVQSTLGVGEVLVLYGLTSEEGLALVVQRDAARAVVLAPPEEIEAAIEALDLSSPEQDPGNAIVTLHELLVDPLRLGADVRRVLLSPIGRLGYVPFSVLLPEREVAYVPSGSTHRLLLSTRTEEGENILAIGDPDYGTIAAATVGSRRGGALMRLPATRDEVNKVGDVKLLGRKATESGLRAALQSQDARWRAVHFACHGLVDPERPRFSSLALTADTENDGLLTALEIFSMKIPADLVVMSACETGRGKIYHTEGIVGLTRAFMFAGAPRVIASLWKVDDNATQEMMVKFYELWRPQTKSLGAAAALKQAQAYIKGQQKWSHPYYWAAWVLWGLPE